MGLDSPWAFPWSWSLILPRAGLGLAAASVLALGLAFFGLSRPRPPSPGSWRPLPAPRAQLKQLAGDVAAAERAAAAMSAIRPGMDPERAMREGQHRVTGD